MIKQYNGNKNIAGLLIKRERKKKHMSKTDLSKKLELQGVYINRSELFLMEENNLMIKDFELTAIAKVLEIDLNKLIKYL